MSLRPKKLAILAALASLGLGWSPVQAQELFWASNDGFSIRRMNLDGSGETSLGTTFVGSGDPVAVSGGKVYWCSGVDFSIRSANLDGSGETSLGTSTVFSDTVLSIDPLGGKIYWAGSGSIHRVNLDGTSEENLGTSAVPGHTRIALDVLNGTMYWGSSVDFQIHRANLDGSSETSLGTSAANWNTVITLDVAGGKMYWASQATNTIHRANLDGSGEEDLMVGLVFGGLFDPAESIVLDRDGKMYWPDASGTIHRANLDGSAEEDLGLSTSVGRIVLAGDKLYWPSSFDNRIHSANLDGSGETSLGSTFISGSEPIVIGCELPAAAGFFNAGSNPASYVATAPILGGSFTATVDLAGTTGHNLALVLGYQTFLTFTLGGGQTLLINIADPNGELLALPAKGGGTPSWNIPVVTDLSYCGLTFSTQAAHFGGVQPFALSNAYDLTVGY